MYYSEADFEKDLSDLYLSLFDIVLKIKREYGACYITGVPRGGCVLASALATKLDISLIAYQGINTDTIIIDDIVDSGTTRNKYPDNIFVCLHTKFTKQEAEKRNIISVHYEQTEYVEYFWETSAAIDMQDNVSRLIQYTGEDLNREGLQQTPKRFLKAWEFLTSGYRLNVSDVITTFKSDGYSEIILLKDIEMYSMCEHHLMPFFGKAHVAYIPDKKIIGVSKLARIVDVFSRRLQIQERICEQVTQALEEYLEPVACACIIEAQHLCMLMRGVQKQNSVMTTSSLKGMFLENDSARQELMRLIK